jgi:hypothetical protein
MIGLSKSSVNLASGIDKVEDFQRQHVGKRIVERIPEVLHVILIGIFELIYQFVLVGHDETASRGKIPIE